MTPSSFRSAWFTVWLVAASPAFAVSASDQARAKLEFQKAQTSYDLAKFSEALVGYSEAYRLDPRPAFLFNIAQCHRQLGEFNKAAFFLRRYLSYFPEGKATNDAVVRDLLSEMETKAAAAARPADAPVTAAPAPAPAPVVAALPPPVEAPGRLTEAPPPPRDDRLITKWWFWTAVGVVAAGAITTAVVVSRPQPRTASLGNGDLR